MSTKTILFAGILMAIVFLTGCVQQQYVCSDNSVVSSPEQCPQPEAPAMANESAAQNVSGNESTMPAINQTPDEMVVEPSPEEQPPQEAPEVFLSESFCDGLDNSYVRDICNEGSFHDDQRTRDYFDKYDAIISDAKDLNDISDGLDNDYTGFFGSQDAGEVAQYYDSFSSNMEDYGNLLDDATGRIDSFISFLVSNNDFLDGEGVDVLQDVGDMTDLKSEQHSVLAKAESDFGIMTTLMEKISNNETFNLVMPEKEPSPQINISKIQHYILN